LILLGFNKLPVSLLLHEPAGAWHLQLDAAAPDFGAAGQQSLPKRFVIPPQGTTVSVPAYVAGLFVRAS